MKKIFVALLAVVCLFMAASCAPKDCSKAKEKLEKAGYSVVVVDSGVALSAAQVFAGEELKGCVTATNGDDAVTAYLYDSAKTAKAKLEAIHEKAGENDTTKVSGKWVIYGTEAGIKAFTK